MSNYRTGCSYWTDNSFLFVFRWRYTQYCVNWKTKSRSTHLNKMDIILSSDKNQTCITVVMGKWLFMTNKSTNNITRNKYKFYIIYFIYQKKKIPIQLNCYYSFDVLAYYWKINIFSEIWKRYPNFSLTYNAKMRKMHVMAVKLL